jgi:hypothetical protein
VVRGELDLLTAPELQGAIDELLAGNIRQLILERISRSD